MSVIFVYFYSKLKLYFWPPVPNPDKVLQGYMTEINQQRWVNYFPSILHNTRYMHALHYTKLKLWCNFFFSSNTNRI